MAVRSAFVGCLAAAAVVLAVNAAGCETVFDTVPADPEKLEFEYRRVGASESILVRGVPDDTESVYSIEGGQPAPLLANGIIEIPPGLSGRVMVSVRWSRGSLVVRSGHRSEMIDLDAKRADGAQPAAAP